MQILLAGLAEGLTEASAVGAKVLGWTGDPTGMADALPLRLAGGLHALVLTGQDPAPLPPPMRLQVPGCLHAVRACPRPKRSP